jgi:hypothetical protein
MKRVSKIEKDEATPRKAEPPQGPRLRRDLHDESQRQAESPGGERNKSFVEALGRFSLSFDARFSLFEVRHPLQVVRLLFGSVLAFDLLVWSARSIATCDAR